MKDYKKILEGVVNIINTTEKSDVGFANICSYIGENCPELKESGAERIRKALIRYFTLSDEHAYNEVCGVSYRDIVTWLEKQGEHAKFRDSIQVGDKVTRNQDGVLVNLSQLKRIAKSTEEYNITGIGSKHAEGKLGEMIRNLKPLGETMQKSAWSEEDEDYLRKAIDAAKVTYPVTAHWLRSLKNRITWKPSEEQMISLRLAVCGCSYDVKPLLELEKQLKKL